MAVTSSGDGNFSSVITGGLSVNDDVIINHDVVMDGHAPNVNSLVINSGKTLTGGGYKITIDGENSSGFAITNDGSISGNLDLEINTTSATSINIGGSAGNCFKDLKLNDANVDLHLYTNTFIDGNLTIAAGQLTCATEGGDARTLTVLGDTTGAGTLTLGNSTYTGGGSGSNLAMLGTVTIGTSGVITTVDELGTVSGSGGTITATGSPTLGHRRLRQLQSKWTPATSTLKLEDGTNAIFGNDGTYAIPYNFEFDNSGNTVELGGNFTVTNNLTITSGTLDTSSSNHALTVTGDVDVTGTLTLNDSTVAVGALRTNSNAALTLGSSGTLELTTASNFGGTEGANYSWRNTDGTSDINLGGTLTVSAAGYFEPRTAPEYASVLNNLVWNTNHYWVGKLTIGGTLVVNASKKMETYNGSKDCIVNGDVTLNGELKALGNNVSAMEFKSLKIASGGTYTATSGTTTLTNKNSSNYMFEDLGTFTHNNGTVHFKADTSSGTWYAVKGHSTEDTTEFYNVTTERVGSSVGNYRVCVGGSNQFFTVRNNLTVGANCKIFSSNGSSILRHSGLATLNGELDLDSFTDIEMGAVTINSGGTLEFDNGSITIKAESLRNVGGTINA